MSTYGTCGLLINTIGEEKECAYLTFEWHYAKGQFVGISFLLLFFTFFMITLKKIFFFLYDKLILFFISFELIDMVKN